MKLADLRKKLRHSKRFGRPVDELDEMLMEKGTMARPEPFDVSGPMVGGRKADVVIIDDPIAADAAMKLPKRDGRADFRSEVLGEWVKEPELGNLPPTLGAMLGNGTVTWNNHEPNRIAGQLVYDRVADDLCEVKSSSSSDTSVAVVWRGERNPDNGQPILRAAELDELFVVKTVPCRNCAGETRWAGRRGLMMKCKQCNGLGRVPTREALAPFKRRER